MLSQKSCINSYISGEFLHFNLHNFSKCVNNACIKYAGDRLTRKGGTVQNFSHCLISLCWLTKNIFPSLSHGRPRRFMFTYPVIHFWRKRYMPGLLYYISQYELLVFGPHLNYVWGRIAAADLWKNPSMHRRGSPFRHMHIWAKMAALIRHLHFIICRQKMIGTFFR